MGNLIDGQPPRGWLWTSVVVGQCDDSTCPTSNEGGSCSNEGCSACLGRTMRVVKYLKHWGAGVPELNDRLIVSPTYPLDAQYSCPDRLALRPVAALLALTALQSLETLAMWSRQSSDVAG